MAWVEGGVVMNFVEILPGQVGEFDADIVRIEGLDVRLGDVWDGERFLREGEPLA